MYTRNILLIGMWYPTNEMLRQFSNQEDINPNGWKGEDWGGHGFDVYSFFPAFNDRDRSAPNPGRGRGDFQVDYQDVYADFTRVVAELKPIAIITFTRNPPGTTAWELERGGRDRSEWGEDSIWPLNPDERSGIFNVTRGISPVWTRITGTRERFFGYLPNRNREFTSNLPLDAILREFGPANNLPAAFIDESKNMGSFISEYVGILGMSYRDQHPTSNPDHFCLSAGGIHVGAETPLDVAVRASETILSCAIHEFKQRHYETIWIGWIGINVKTSEAVFSETGNTISVTIYRGNERIRTIDLDAPGHEDMTRGQEYFYSFKIDGMFTEETEPPQPDVGRSPSPYPPYGMEFSKGIAKELRLEVTIDGEDAWTASTFEVLIKEWTNPTYGAPFSGWNLHDEWISIYLADSPFSLSKDSNEGPDKYMINI